jgi:acetyl esterase/lipase
MRRLRRSSLALLALAVVLVAWEPSRVGLQTAILLPNLLDAGPKPLNLFSEAPQRTSVPYRVAEPGSQPDLAELWLPAWASAESPAGAVLLVFGVNNLGRNHPVIERVADGLARTGVAVLVPDARTLLEGRLEIGEIDGVVRAFQLLATRPEIDRSRVGIVGFSVGGSLALLAAGDPRIAGQVRWVNAFGAFADASTYLAAVAAHAYRGSDGAVVPWMPSPLVREVYMGLLLDQVGDERDRRLLDAAFAEPILSADRPPPNASIRGSLETDAARLIHDLLTTSALEDAEAAIEALPAPSRETIDALSPVRHLADIRAEIHLMHDTADHHVPFVESRALASALDASGRLAAHTEFRLFDHVQPDDLDPMAAAPELVKLLLHVRTLMEETL